MLHQAKVTAGRALRTMNRRISGLYLRLVARPGGAGRAFRRLGSDYGSWYVPDDMPDGALCYCVGVGNDATFDFALAAAGQEVHAFDPTPGSIEYMERHDDEGVQFHPWGLWNEDTTLRFYHPLSEHHHSFFVNDLHSTGRFFEADCRRMRTILDDLGHETPYLVKMDIEGAWFEAVADMLASGIRPEILGVEFDSPAPLPRVAKTVRRLQSHGYRLAVLDGDNATFAR